MSGLHADGSHWRTGPLPDVRALEGQGRARCHMVTPDIKAIVPKLEPVLAKPFTQLFLDARTGG